MEHSSLLVSTILKFISKYALLPPNSNVVLGLSGGPDSVFLAHILAKMQQEGAITVVAAHLNHGWRPDADQDEQFCRRLAESLGMRFETARLSEIGKGLIYDGSREAFARQARRLLFQKTARAHRADRIALAHHADDQQETFFLRLIRGASLTGLTAMKPYHGMYIRPLLMAYKHDILEYLQVNAIAYCTDYSNQEETYLRNRIRMAVVPALKKADVRFETSFSRTLESLQQTELFLERLSLRALQESMCSISGIGEALEIKKVFSFDPVIRDRVLMQWLIQSGVAYTPRKSFLEEITRFLGSPRGGSHLVRQKWRLIKRQNKAYVQKLEL